MGQLDINSVISKSLLYPNSFSAQKKILSRVLFFAFAICAKESPIFSDVVIFESKEEFLNVTNSVAATEIPSTPDTFFPSGAGFTSGDLSFALLPPASRFVIDELTQRLDGNDLGLSNVENFSVTLNVGNVSEFGFDFVEPEFDGGLGAPFFDSVFEITIKSNSEIIFQFEFERENDSAQFVGFSMLDGSTFDQVEIREIIGGLENDFFGQFYIGSNDSILGDVNLDGEVNLLDVAPFVEAVTSGEFLPAADINCDGAVDLLDVAPFVDLLVN